MRKVDSFLRECQRLEGMSASQCLCLPSSGEAHADIRDLFSGHRTQGLEGLYVLGWNVYTKRNAGRYRHSIYTL